MSTAGNGNNTKYLQDNANLGTFNGACSVCFWVCPSGNTFGPGTDGFVTVLDLGVNGGGGNFDWQFYFDISPNNLTLHYTNYTSGTPTVDQVVGTLSATVMSFVALTHDPAAAGGTTKLYLGTGPGSALSLVATLTGDVWTGTMGNLTLFNWFGDTEPLNGEMTGWRQWSVVLTQTELENEYSSIKPKSRISNLVRFYPWLNEPQDNIDQSGSGFNMTKTGTLATARRMPSVPWGSPPVAMGYG